MTIHELLTSVSFDEILETLYKIRHGDYAIKNPADYKEAFDYICHLQPRPEEGSVDFAVSPRESWPEKELAIIAEQIEGIWWDDVICRKVIRPESVEVTDTELAASILWEMTLFGFTDEPRNYVEELYSDYGLRACELMHKLYLPYIKDKETKRELREHRHEPEVFGMGFTWEVSRLIEYRMLHQNRSKRKRFHRMNQQIEKLSLLDNLMGVYQFLQPIFAPDGSECLKERILNASQYTHYTRRSRAYGKTGRIAYLKDVINCYDNELDSIISASDEVFIIAGISKETPLTEAERTELDELMSSIITEMTFPAQLAIKPSDVEPGEMTLDFTTLKYRKQ